MRHVAYPKIPTARRLGGTTPGGVWIATEKVHGAQLVVAYDGHRLRVGKRKAWLADDEPFFGWQLLRGRLALAAAAALRMAAAHGGTAVRLYGELYGGHYPDPTVPAVPGATAVQTGVGYCPDIRFALFDVLHHRDADDPGVFGTYADVVAVAGAGGLDVVPLLARGTRSSVDAVPVRFASRVPSLLGLPPLPDNLAEGVVLRPDVAASPPDRPVLKVKIAEFDEGRYDASRPWDPHAAVAPADLARLAGGLVNAARLASARSKVGPHDADALLDEVVLDVMIDVSEALPSATAALTGAQQRAIEAAIRAAARTVDR